MQYTVKIDHDLSVATLDDIFQTRTLDIEFYDFLENVCIIQTRELNPSNYVNFGEFSYIKSWINTEKPLTFVAIDGRSEDKQKLSEDVGVGLAMCSVEKLWGKAHFKKIYLTGQRPDIEAVLTNGDRLIIEAKGTGQIYTSAIINAFNKAEVQKNVFLGTGYFERIVSITQLLSDRSSIVYLVDPPTSEPRKATQNEIMGTKAHTYSKLFSSYGFAELSRYFQLLSRRYMEINFDQSSLNEKINLLKKILNQFKYRYDKVNYYGHIRKINNKNIFLGVNEDLLYLETFASFEEEKSKVIQSNNNIIKVSKRGFITIEFDDPKQLGWKIENKNIINNYSFLTISDVDEMSTIGLENFISYIFTENGHEVLNQKNSKEFHSDLIIKNKNNTLYSVEIKKVLKKNYFKIPTISSTHIINQDKNFKKSILITNAIVEKNSLIENKNLLIWDRETLKIIIKTKNISEFLL